MEAKLNQMERLLWSMRKEVNDFDKAKEQKHPYEWSNLKKVVAAHMKKAGLCEEWRSTATEASDIDHFFRLLKRKHLHELREAERDAYKDVYSDEYATVHGLLDCIPANLDLTSYMGTEKLKAALKLADQFEPNELEWMVNNEALYPKSA